MYVLGNIFLNNYYVVYDLENYRVGLVPSKNSSVGETQVVKDVALIIQDFVQSQNIIYYFCKDKPRGFIEKSLRYIGLKQI